MARTYLFPELSVANETIDWQKDVDAALAQAAHENKPLLLDVTAAPT
ncbi:MAG TPA: hypothetical protein VGH98_21760 [Gemmatimonadaceae bacterium]|jgi:uncharacterized protein YyaL (SSP411 family)